MKFLQKIILIGLFIYLPYSSNAWGVLGHRIVGQIADCYLTAKTKTAVEKILGYESIAMVSNWADFIKSDTNYKYISPWHYVNFRDGWNIDSISNFLHADTAVDAYTKINFLTTELKNNKLMAIATKQMYLKLLIHIIGDIHQPLHVGRDEDKGGNSIKLKWFNDPTNLHQVWDSKLIDFQQLSYTEYATAINHCTTVQLADWKKLTLVQWLYDSYTLSEKVYAETAADTRLDYSYNFKFIDLLNNQLLKGGVHLANILNDIL